MDQDILHLLQKYNMDSEQKPLTERLVEPDRFKNFSKCSGDLLLDFSRTRVDQAALNQLVKLAAHSGVEESIERLFQGDAVNFTEQRPALHMAMRSDEVLRRLDTEIAARVSGNRDRMLGFATAFAAGHLPAAAEQPVRHIIHIGIGGSVLGPRLLIEALGRLSSPQVHFLSSVDAHYRDGLLADLDPAETVVIVATKSFTTGETLLHARRVMQWMQLELGRDAALQRLFAVSGNMAAVEDFGVPQANTLFLPDWVGGRYSIWSAVSLSAAAVMGEGAFSEFLQGAADMDRHFQTAALADNLPVLMALIGIWHRNICGYPAQAVIPYDHRLRSVPAYLQQLVMESGGKSVDREGQPVNCDTSPVLFGEPGTDAQHSLFQMFHQGTDIVPLDFIGVIKPGWCRISMHYVMDDLEVDFLLDSIDFVARYGGLFLRLYDFDLYDGSWSKKNDPTSLQRFSLEAALEAGMGEQEPMPPEERFERYTSYLDQALELARNMQKQHPSVEHTLGGKLGELQFFALPEGSLNAGKNKSGKGLFGKLKSIFKK